MPSTVEDGVAGAVAAARRTERRRMCMAPRFARGRREMQAAPCGLSVDLAGLDALLELLPGHPFKPSFGRECASPPRQESTGTGTTGGRAGAQPQRKWRTDAEGASATRAPR